MKSFTQDSAGRLTIVAHTRPAPAGSLPVSYSYKYFADGRLLEEFASTDGTTSQGYDDANNRIAKKFTVTGQSPVTESYVWDGGNRVAVLNASGIASHQYFDAPSLDHQVCAEHSSVSGILWPLEDQNGTVRDVINSAGVTQDHRVLSSFGAITSQTNSGLLQPGAV